MADFRNTIRQVNYAYAHKTNSNGQLAPNNNIGYGPWDSLQEAWTNLLAIFGNEASLIPIGITVGIYNEDNTITEYWLQGGHAQTNLVEKGGIGDLDADDITFSPSSSSPSGSVGAKIKELAAAVEESAGSKIEPTYDAIVDLSSLAASGLHFTYDPDNRYVYNGNPTTMFTYVSSNNLYAVFKVLDDDLFLVYSVTHVEQSGDEYTYSNTYDTEHLPAIAKVEFEMGDLAAIKRISGAAGECWKNGSISLLCTRDNLVLRHRLRQITVIGESQPSWCVLVKSEDGNSIFIYKANQSDNNYYYLTTVTSSSPTNFKYYDKFFDYKEASDIDYNNTTSGLSSTNVKDAIDELSKLGYEAITTYPTGGVISNPTKNTYYDFDVSTGRSAIDVHNIVPGNNYEVVIKFKTDSTCTITASTSQQILGTTTLYADTVYIMAILHGVICICEAPQYVQPV